MVVHASRRPAPGGTLRRVRITTRCNDIFFFFFLPYPLFARGSRRQSLSHELVLVRVWVGCRSHGTRTRMLMMKRKTQADIKSDVRFTYPAAYPLATTSERKRKKRLDLDLLSAVHGTSTSTWSYPVFFGALLRSFPSFSSDSRTLCICRARAAWGTSKVRMHIRRPTRPARGTHVCRLWRRTAQRLGTVDSLSLVSGTAACTLPLHRRARARKRIFGSNANPSLLVPLLLRPVATLSRRVESLSSS